MPFVEPLAPLDNRGAFDADLEAIAAVEQAACLGLKRAAPPQSSFLEPLNPACSCRPAGSDTSADPAPTREPFV
jgi:hypothetical protein